MGQLDITGWGFLLGLGAATGLAWAWVAIGACRPRGHRRPRTGRCFGLRLRFRSAWLVAVLVTSLLAADAVNSYFSDLPHLGDVVSVATGRHSWPGLEPQDLQPSNYPEAAREAPRGGVVELPIPDAGSGFGRSTALVYLPPQYFTEPGRHFQVVYLLHGSPGTPADWIRGGGAVQTGAALAAVGQPAVIVMPRMSHHWLDDPECVDGIRLRAETHLISDVLPTVDGAVRTVPTADGRVIAGMSAGGFCALNLGLRHPDLFGTIVDMSGLDRPTHRGGVAALFGPGEQGLARAAANDPSRYAARLPERLPTRIWLDSGRSDGAVLAGMNRLEVTFRRRGIDARLTARPGSHTYSVWRPALRQALAWALRPSR